MHYLQIMMEKREKKKGRNKYNATFSDEIPYHLEIEYGSEGWSHLISLFLWWQVLAPVVSFFIPRFQCRAANKQGISVSRDPAALLAKYSDPLVYTGSIRVKTGYEILRISTYLQQNLSRLRVPFLVLHGAADNVTDPEASKTLHEEAASTDKTFKLYEGLLHDLLFEPEREAIMKDIIEWLNCRVDG